MLYICGYFMGRNFSIYFLAKHTLCLMVRFYINGNGQVILHFLYYMAQFNMYL